MAKPKPNNPKKQDKKLIIKMDSARILKERRLCAKERTAFFLDKRTKKKRVKSADEKSDIEDQND